MPRRNAIPEFLPQQDTKKLWARQYLIETFNTHGRCDIEGLALTLGISVEKVHKQFADLLQFLEAREFFISHSDI